MQFPRAAGLIDELNLNYIANEEYARMPERIQKGEKVFLLGTKKYQDFFRHVRNAIAHGRIEKKGKYYVFNDVGDIALKRRGKNKNVQTACGRISCNRLNHIIQIVLRNN